MANVVDGDNNTFNLLAYGENNQGVMNYLNEQREMISSRLSDVGRQWYNSAADIYRQVDNSRAMQLLRAAERTINHYWDDDRVRYMNDIGTFQQAKPMMQRYIMADETVRSRYLQGQCSGFADTYVNYDGKDIGRTHYDYRRAVDGVVQTDEQDENWKVSMYFEDELEHDIKLDRSQQADIASTWVNVRAAMKRNREDPTSAWNNPL